MVDVSFEMRALKPDGSAACRTLDTTERSVWLGESDGEELTRQGALRLWFARRLIVSLRGHTSVKCVDGMLSVVFTIPYERPSNILPPEKTEPTPVFPKVPPDGPPRREPKVLVIERCRPLRQMLESYLVEWSFQAVGCSTLREATTIMESDANVKAVLVNLHHDDSTATSHDSMAGIVLDDSGQPLGMPGMFEPNIPDLPGEPDASPVDRPPQTAPTRSDYFELLKLKKSGAFTGLQVVALSPFKLPSLTFLKASTERNANFATPAEFKGWQVARSHDGMDSSARLTSRPPRPPFVPPFVPPRPRC